MTLDVFADLACPWCYIGEVRLARALAARPHLAVERRWRPFLLHPTLAPWTPWAPFAERKFGGAERARAAFAHVARVGAEDGIAFDFEAMPTAPNTLDAHRLVLLGEAHERGAETAQALYEGYFARGRNLNDPHDLLALAEAAGLPGAAAEAVLAGDRFRDRVFRSQEAARHLGIGGVPYYVIDARFTLSGAQPVEVFLDRLDRAAVAGLEEPRPG